MADYAGAVAAMRSRFASLFTETTNIVYQNEDPPANPWPPTDTPWVYFEIIQSNSEIRGAGLPGSQTWLTMGHIFVHVFTPLGYGLPESLRIADLAGEVFRAATFYQDGAGAKVICMAPQTDGGDSSADNGDWFRVTTRVPFEFYFLK